MDFITVDGERVPIPEGTPDAALPQLAARHRAQKDMAGRDPFTRGAYGFANAVAEPIVGIAQGIERLTGRDTTDRDLQIAQMRGARAGAGTAGTVGEVGAFALPGGAGSKLVAKAGSKMLPRALAAAGVSAAEQGLYEGARGTEGDESRLQNAAGGALWGAGGGVVGHALPAALSRVAKPVQASEAVQNVVRQFRDAGMKPRMTVGQAVNGTVGDIERGMTSMPGTSVRNAREAAVEEWNRAQLVNAGRGAGLSIGPQNIPRAGHQGVEVLQREKNALYDRALAGQQLTETPDFAARMAAPQQRLTPDDAGKVSKTAENLLADIRSGNVRGEKVKEIDSELRQLASKAYQDGQYELGRAYEQVHGDYRNLMDFWMEGSRGMDDLTRADALYARLVPLQNAAAMAGSLARGGVFTPSQVLSQMRSANPKSVLARGGVPGQENIEAAQQVFGDLPNSGTADRLLSSALVGGGAAAAADQLVTGDVNPTSTAAFALPVIAGMALSRPGVARAAIGDLDWQRALQRSPQWLAAQARIEALRGPTRAAAARLAQEQEDEKRRRLGY